MGSTFHVSAGVAVAVLIHRLLASSISPHMWDCPWWTCSDCSRSRSRAVVVTALLSCDSCLSSFAVLLLCFTFSLRSRSAENSEKRPTVPRPRCRVVTLQHGTPAMTLTLDLKRKPFDSLVWVMTCETTFAVQRTKRLNRQYYVPIFQEVTARESIGTGTTRVVSKSNRARWVSPHTNVTTTTATSTTTARR